MSRKTRKLMWSAPLVAVLAVVGALAAFATLAPNDASAQTASGMELPGMVQNLMVKAYEDGTPQEELEVSWGAPTEGGFVTSYRIDISDDGMRWFSYITDHLDSDTSFIYGDDAGEMLLAKQTKHFRVFAFNDHGTGPGYDASGATSASHVPERPTLLTATDGTGFTTSTVVNEADVGMDLNDDDDAEDEDITLSQAQADRFNRTAIMLSWEAPDDPPGAPVTGYRVEYSRDGNRWLHLTDTGKAAASYYHTGLRADSEFQYRIYALNSVGRSTVSDGATGKTAMSVAPAISTLPVIGLSPASTDVHLKWTPPANPDGDPITHYRIQARTAGSETADDDMWMPLHAGKHIAVANVYNFAGDDLTRAGIKYPRTIPADTDTDQFTELVDIDIRIAAINRANTDATDEEIAEDNDDHGRWLVLEDVPVGHEDAPKRAGTPGVKHDQSQHQGRSGLDVTWPKATFIQGEGPADDATFATAVTYILVINGVEQTAVAHGAERDGGTPPTGALLAGGDETKPGHDDNGLATETERKYQVYALHSAVTVTDASVRGFPSSEKSGETARPTPPGRPEDLTVTADGHTEIKLTWNAPSGDIAAAEDCGGTAPTDNDGDGSECGDSVITGYQIQMSRTGTSGWQTLEAMYADEDMPTTYLANMLTPGQRYHFRVAALNSRGKGQYSAVKSEETHEAGEPTPPGGLVAQAMGRNAVKLCWFEQNLVDPLTGEARLDEGLPVLGYKITVSYMGGSDGTTEMTKTLVENTGSKDTEYTATGLMPDTKYTFMVRSITLGGVGTKSDTASATTDPADVPGMPTGVTATADSDTQITVNWTAPADNGGADITGYIIERRYTGDMMGDIPSDGYSGMNGANRSFAFSNAMEWWETLNCKGMLGAAGSSADPTDATNADVMMYCAHFLNTAPTNISDATKELSADAKTAVQALFDKRYEVLTGTATSHVDMNLMEMTAYTYRVSAVNAAGRSAWSAPDSATTDRTNVAPMAEGTIAAVTVTEGMTESVDVSGAFMDADPEDATLTYSSVSSNTAAATVNATGNPVMIMGVAPGMATITVTATDGMGETAMQDIMVTVEAANADPMAVGSIPAVTVMAGEMSDAITLGGYFNDADGDALTYTQSSSDDMIATAMIAEDDSDPGNPVHTLTITGVAEGSATITVTASDGMGGTDATQTIMVTVEAAPVPLVAPTITGTNPVGSGIVLVSWDTVASATGYSLIATNLSDPSAPTRTAAAAADANSGQVQGLTVGDEYLVFVGAFNDDLEFELSAYVRFTAE